MKNEDEAQSAVGRALDLATETFKNSGKVPELVVNRHRGTGMHGITNLPPDWEDGMRQMTRRIGRHAGGIDPSGC